MSRLKIWDQSTSTWLYPGGGNTVGAASSTDNAIARFDGVSGQVIQNSVVTMDDSGTISGATLSSPVINSPTGFASGWGKLTVSTSAPSSPSVNDIWIDAN